MVPGNVNYECMTENTDYYINTIYHADSRETTQLKIYKNVEKQNSFIETTVKSRTHVKNKMNKKKIIFKPKNN